jgi:hypothetical protein
LAFCSELSEKDLGTSGHKAATLSLLADRSVPYYDDGFADHVRLQRLRQRLPRWNRWPAASSGDMAIVDAFRKEMQEIDRQIGRDSRKDGRVESG